MSTLGDNGDSFGLFQVRRPFHCTEPGCQQFRDDAAFNADYYGGILRAYYDGKQSWLNTCRGRTASATGRGDLRALGRRLVFGRGGGTAAPAATPRGQAAAEGAHGGA